MNDQDSNNNRNGYVRWAVFIWIVGIFTLLLSGVFFLSNNALSTAQNNRVDIRGLQSDTTAILKSMERVERQTEKILTNWDKVQGKTIINSLQ
jgi:hypothetical protein